MVGVYKVLRPGEAPSIEIAEEEAINSVFDKNKYELAINDATVDFADLAEEVMGDKNDDFNGVS